MRDGLAALHCPRLGEHEPHSWDPDDFGMPGQYWCDGSAIA